MRQGWNNICAKMSLLVSFAVRQFSPQPCTIESERRSSYGMRIREVPRRRTRLNSVHASQMPDFGHKGCTAVLRGARQQPAGSKPPYLQRGVPSRPTHHVIGVCSRLCSRERERAAAELPSHFPQLLSGSGFRTKSDESTPSRSSTVHCSGWGRVRTGYGGSTFAADFLEDTARANRLVEHCAFIFGEGLARGVCLLGCSCIRSMETT